MSSSRSASPGPNKKNYSRSEWSALSIQERIRAMNDTLDDVDESEQANLEWGSDHGVDDMSMSGVSSLPPRPSLVSRQSSRLSLDSRNQQLPPPSSKWSASPPQPAHPPSLQGESPRRASVVEMWRRRDSSDAASEVAESLSQQPQQQFQAQQQSSPSFGMLQEPSSSSSVKDKLRKRFSSGANGSSEVEPPKEPSENDNAMISPFRRTATSTSNPPPRSPTPSWKRKPNDVEDSKPEIPSWKKKEETPSNTRNNSPPAWKKAASESDLTIVPADPKPRGVGNVNSPKPSWRMRSVVTNPETVDNESETRITPTNVSSPSWKKKTVVATPPEPNKSDLTIVPTTSVPSWKKKSSPVSTDAKVAPASNGPSWKQKADAANQAWKQRSVVTQPVTNDPPDLTVVPSAGTPSWKTRTDNNVFVEPHDTVEEDVREGNNTPTWQKKGTFSPRGADAQAPSWKKKVAVSAPPTQEPDAGSSPSWPQKEEASNSGSFVPAWRRKQMETQKNTEQPSEKIDAARQPSWKKKQSSPNEPEPSTDLQVVPSTPDPVSQRKSTIESPALNVEVVPEETKGPGSDRPKSVTDFWAQKGLRPISTTATNEAEAATLEPPPFQPDTNQQQTGTPSSRVSVLDRWKKRAQSSTGEVEEPAVDDAAESKSQVSSVSRTSRLEQLMAMTSGKSSLTRDTPSTNGKAVVAFPSNDQAPPTFSLSRSDEEKSEKDIDALEKEFNSAVRVSTKSPVRVRASSPVVDAASTALQKYAGDSPRSRVSSPSNASRKAGLQHTLDSDKRPALNTPQRSASPSIRARMAQFNQGSPTAPSDDNTADQSNKDAVSRSQLPPTSPSIADRMAHLQQKTSPRLNDSQRPERRPGRAASPSVAARMAHLQQPTLNDERQVVSHEPKEDHQRNRPVEPKDETRKESLPDQKSAQRGSVLDRWPSAARQRAESPSPSISNESSNNGLRQTGTPRGSVKNRWQFGKQKDQSNAQDSLSDRPPAKKELPATSITKHSVASSHSSVKSRWVSNPDSDPIVGKSSHASIHKGQTAESPSPLAVSVPSISVQPPLWQVTPRGSVKNRWPHQQVQPDGNDAVQNHDKKDELTIEPPGTNGQRAESSSVASASSNVVPLPNWQASPRGSVKNRWRPAKDQEQEPKATSAAEERPFLPPVKTGTRAESPSPTIASSSSSNAVPSWQTTPRGSVKNRWPLGNDKEHTTISSNGEWRSNRGMRSESPSPSLASASSNMTPLTTPGGSVKNRWPHGQGRCEKEQSAVSSDGGTSIQLPPATRGIRAESPSPTVASAPKNAVPLLTRKAALDGTTENRWPAEEVKHSNQVKAVSNNEDRAFCPPKREASGTESPFEVSAHTGAQLPNWQSTPGGSVKDRWLHGQRHDDGQDTVPATDSMIYHPPIHKGTRVESPAPSLTSSTSNGAPVNGVPLPSWQSTSTGSDTNQWSHEQRQQEEQAVLSTTNNEAARPPIHRGTQESPSPSMTSSVSNGAPVNGLPLPAWQATPDGSVASRRPHGQKEQATVTTVNEAIHAPIYKGTRGESPSPSITSSTSNTAPTNGAQLPSWQSTPGGSVKNRWPHGQRQDEEQGQSQPTIRHKEIRAESPFHSSSSSLSNAAPMPTWQPPGGHRAGQQNDHQNSESSGDQEDRHMSSSDIRAVIEPTNENVESSAGLPQPTAHQQGLLSHDQMDSTQPSEYYAEDETTGPYAAPESIPQGNHLHQSFNVPEMINEDNGMNIGQNEEMLNSRLKGSSHSRWETMANKTERRKQPSSRTFKSVASRWQPPVDQQNSQAHSDSQQEMNGLVTAGLSSSSDTSGNQNVVSKWEEAQAVQSTQVPNEATSNSGAVSIQSPVNVPPLSGVENDDLPASSDSPKRLSSDSRHSPATPDHAAARKTETAAKGGPSLSSPSRFSPLRTPPRKPKGNSVADRSLRLPTVSDGPSAHDPSTQPTEFSPNTLRRRTIDVDPKTATPMEMLTAHNAPNEPSGDRNAQMSAGGTLHTAYSPARQKQQQVQRDLELADEKKESEDTDEGSVGPFVLMLMSSQSLSRDQTACHQRATSIFNGHRIPFEELDGALLPNRARRNELFELSGVRAKYPQFFVVQNGHTSYWGDWSALHLCNENGNIRSAFGFTTNTLPDKTINRNQGLTTEALKTQSFSSMHAIKTQGSQSSGVSEGKPVNMVQSLNEMGGNPKTIASPKSIKAKLLPRLPQSRYGAAESFSSSVLKSLPKQEGGTKDNPSSSSLSKLRALNHKQSASVISRQKENASKAQEEHDAKKSKFKSLGRRHLSPSLTSPNEAPIVSTDLKMARATEENIKKDAKVDDGTVGIPSTQAQPEKVTAQKNASSRSAFSFNIHAHRAFAARKGALGSMKDDLIDVQPRAAIHTRDDHTTKDPVKAPDERESGSAPRATASSRMAGRRLLKKKRELQALRHQQKQRVNPATSGNKVDSIDSIGDPVSSNASSRDDTSYTSHFDTDDEPSVNISSRVSSSYEKPTFDKGSFDKQSNATDDVHHSFSESAHHDTQATGSGELHENLHRYSEDDNENPKLGSEKVHENPRHSYSVGAEENLSLEPDEVLEKAHRSYSEGGEGIATLEVEELHENPTMGSDFLISKMHSDPSDVASANEPNISHSNFHQSLMTSEQISEKVIGPGKDRMNQEFISPVSNDDSGVFDSPETRNEARFSFSKNDAHNYDIPSTSSGMSGVSRGSSIANRAERLLKQRRKKSAQGVRDSSAVDKSGASDYSRKFFQGDSAGPESSFTPQHSVAITADASPSFAGQSYSPLNGQAGLETPASSNLMQRASSAIADRTRLSSRYQTQSRFMSNPEYAQHPDSFSYQDSTSMSMSAMMQETIEERPDAPESSSYELMQMQAQKPEVAASSSLDDTATYDASRILEVSTAGWTREDNDSLISGSAFQESAIGSEFDSEFSPRHSAIAEEEDVEGLSSVAETESKQDSTWFGMGVFKGGKHKLNSHSGQDSLMKEPSEDQDGYIGGSCNDFMQFGEEAAAIEVEYMEDESEDEDDAVGFCSSQNICDTTSPENARPKKRKSKRRAA